MNCIRGTVGDVSFKEIGKFKDQKGFVEGMYRNTVFVQSGADSAVVCETIKAFIDPQHDVVILFTGDSDLAPIFDTCLSGNALAGNTSAETPSLENTCHES